MPDKRIQELLKKQVSRMTKQRSAVSNLIFSKGHRHLTPESLYKEAHKSGIKVSLATIYNTLHKLVECGLIHYVNTPKGIVFDTNVDNHAHFYYEKSGDIVDIHEKIDVKHPKINGKIVGIDVLIRVEE